MSGKKLFEQDKRRFSRNCTFAGAQKRDWRDVTSLAVYPFRCGVILTVHNIHESAASKFCGARKSCGWTLQNPLIREIASSKVLEMNKQMIWSLVAFTSWVISRYA